jgi:hypothetical protein
MFFRFQPLKKRRIVESTDDEEHVPKTKDRKNIKKSGLKKIQLHRECSGDTITDNVYLTTTDLSEIKNSVEFKRSLNKQMLSNPTVTLHNNQLLCDTLSISGGVATHHTHPLEGASGGVVTHPLEGVSETSLTQDVEHSNHNIETSISSVVVQSLPLQTPQTLNTNMINTHEIVTTPVVASNVVVNTHPMPLHHNTTPHIQRYFTPKPKDIMSRLMNHNYPSQVPRHQPTPSISNTQSFVDLTTQNSSNTQ